MPEEFLYNVNQVVYLRKDNTKWIIIDCFSDSNTYQIANIPVYKIKNIENNNEYHARQNEITLSNATDYENCPFRVGDILYVKNGPQIRVKKIEPTKNDFTVYPENEELTTFTTNSLSFFRHRTCRGITRNSC